MFNRQLRAENDYEEISVVNLMPAILKATMELYGTIAYACLERLEGIAVGTFLRFRLTPDGSFLLNRQLPVLYFNLRRVFAALSDDYLRFTRHNTLPPPPTFLGDLDSTDPFFVITQADIEADPNLFREQAVVHQQNADGFFPRHRPEMIALKNELVSFLSKVINDFRNHLPNLADIIVNEKEIFDAANRILRCLPIIAKAINCTIEQEAALNRRCARAN